MIAGGHKVDDLHPKAIGHFQGWHVRPSNRNDIDQRKPYWLGPKVGDRQRKCRALKGNAVKYFAMS